MKPQETTRPTILPASAKWWASALEANAKKHRELFDRQDEIQRKRDDLTDELERQLKQESTVSTLLICR